MQFRDRDFHIVPGLSAGGTLHRLGIAWTSMCIAEDDFSCGPLVPLDDLDQFRRLRQGFWRTKGDVRSGDWKGQDIPFMPLNTLDGSSARLRSAERIFLWLGTTLLEQLVLAWAVTAFRNLGIAPGTLRLLDLKASRSDPERSIRALNCENIRKMARWRRPAKLELATYESAWCAVSNPTPEGLLEFCGSDVQHHGPLKESLSSFMARYPAAETGLNYWDRIVLVNSREHGPRAARILGYTIAHDRVYPDRPDDLYLFDRLKRLGDSQLARPLLTLSGDLSEFRSTEAAITETGRKVLAGEANHVALNGIDDWVGGVHLKARSGSPWVFDGETLVLGHTA